MRHIHKPKRSVRFHANCLSFFSTHTLCKWMKPLGFFYFSVNLIYRCTATNELVGIFCSVGKSRTPTVRNNYNRLFYDFFYKL